jgi:hypothetical protein
MALRKRGAPGWLIHHSSHGLQYACRPYVDLPRLHGIGSSMGRLGGSSANARVAGDDGEMQRFVPIEDLFKGRHFDGQIIILSVAWYTSFKLSLRDLVIMMADRGISVTHTTILRWVQRYLPEFEKRWWRYARLVGGSWRMDETYLRVHGQWVYLYLAVDKRGPNGRFLSQPEPGRKRRQIVSPQRDEEYSCAHEDHVGRLCGLAPGSARDEGRRRTSSAGEGTLQPVFEQSGGAGPSESEATNPAHAGIQAIRQCGGNDFRDRVGGEDQKKDNTRRAS